MRSEDDLQRLFDAGVERVVVGSIAVRDPDMRDRLAATLWRAAPDHRTGYALARRRLAAAPAPAGPSMPTVSLDELAPRFSAAGAVHLLCTDIDRDGMLSGPNITSLQSLARYSSSSFAFRHPVA